VLRPGQYAGEVLRLLDARSGRYAEVRPGQAGLLRVGAYLRRGTGQPDWTGVRVLLIADLLARAAELRGLQVLTAVVFPGDPPAEQGFAERTAGALGVHPPAARASSPRAAVVLGGPVDVHIAGPEGVDDGPDGLVTQAGTARMCGAVSGESDPVAAGAVPADDDPLAIRLALMSHPHDHVVELTAGALARARETTTQWRNQVAGWAESPSRPMPQLPRAELDAAFSDLDIPQALALLDSLAQDRDVPDGARFETFVFADRVLGLELARHVGRPRP
jgi:hypothetical protein